MSQLMTWSISIHLILTNTVYSVSFFLTGNTVLYISNKEINENT